MAESKKTPLPSTPPNLPKLVLPANLTSVYANMVRIAHTPAELVFDFARMLPGDAVPTVQARVLMSPLGAKLFLNALTENLAKYEASFGPIQIPHQQSLADFLFRPPAGPDDKDEPESK
ncbi:MAG: DUF3467 domain-containing protein [Anaerolineae bacterium]|nr:MAG: DUF3467 domain-containing protein [Anaerolineae bacterium]